MTMTRWALGIAAVLGVLASGLRAQVTCSALTGPSGGPASTCVTPTTITATMTVVQVGRLAISTGSTAIQSGANVSVGDYEASEDTVSGNVFMGPLLGVSANKAYTVTFTNPAAFTLAPSAKTAAHVKWSVSGTAGACASPYTSLSVTGATQTVGLGAATALNQFQLCFRVKWIWASNPPGTYRMPITFTLTAP